MPNIEKIIDFQKKKKIFHQKFPVVTSNAILAFGKSDEKFFRQKSKQFLLGFRNQTDEYIFFPKKWSCSKKNSLNTQNTILTKVPKVFSSEVPRQCIQIWEYLLKKTLKKLKPSSRRFECNFDNLDKSFQSKKQNVSWLIFEIIEIITSFLRNI